MNAVATMDTTQTNVMAGAGHLPAIPIVLSSRMDNQPPINLLESLYDSIVLTDLAGSVRQCNQRAVDLMGYTRTELCGLTVGHLVMGVTPELLSTLEQHHSGGRFSVLEGRCNRKNGSSFPAEIAVSSVASGAGRGFCFALRNALRLG